MACACRPAPSAGPESERAGTEADAARAVSGPDVTADAANDGPADRSDTAHAPVQEAGGVDPMLREVVDLIDRRAELCERADPRRRCEQHMLDVKVHAAAVDPAQAAMLALISPEPDAGAACVVTPDSHCPSTVSHAPEITALDKRFQGRFPSSSTFVSVEGACGAWREAAPRCRDETRHYGLRDNAADGGSSVP
jgi:hypothetical protein